MKAFDIVFVQEQIMMTKDSLSQNIEAVKRKYSVNIFLVFFPIVEFVQVFKLMNSVTRWSIAGISDDDGTLRMPADIISRRC